MEPGETHFQNAQWHSNDETAREHACERLTLLLKLVASGDKEAMSEIHKMTSGRLYALLLQMLPGQEDADEALQDVYLTVWRRAGTFMPGQGSPMTWLITIARNKAVDRLRSERNAHNTGPLDEMAEGLRPVSPPKAVWTNIERSLDGAALAVAAKNARQSTASLWDNIAFWRGLSFAGTGAAIAASVVALLLFWQTGAFLPRRDRLVATLQADEGRTAFVATYDPLRNQIITVPARLIRKKERVPELWLVTKDERAVSLGVIASESAQVVVVPPDLVDDTSEGTALVITLEPPGGAPGGVATGSAIAQGELAPI